MPKKKIEEKSPKPEKIDVDFGEGKITLSFGKQEFYLNHDDLMRLVSVGFTPDGHVRASDLVNTEKFSEWNTLDFICKAHVLLNRRQLRPDEAAEILKVDKAKFKAWIGDLGSIKFRNNQLNAMPTESSRIMKEYEQEMFPEEPKPEELDFDHKGIDRIAKLFQEGRGPREVAAKLKVPVQDFLAWYGRGSNMAHVNKVMRTITVRENPPQPEPPGHQVEIY